MLPQVFSLLPRFQRTPSQLCSFVLQVLWCLKNKYRLSVRFVILMPGTDRWMWGYVCSLLWLCWITFMEETWKLLMMKISWIKNRKETNHPIEFCCFFIFFHWGFRDISEVEYTVTLQYNKLSSIQVVFKAILTVMNWTYISLTITILQITFIHVWWMLYFLHYWKKGTMPYSVLRFCMGCSSRENNCKTQKAMHCNDFALVKACSSILVF